MLKQGHGKIFNMEGFGSDGRIMNKLTLYGTTKRAVNYFTKSASLEVKKSPIQIGILSPGMVRTDFLNQSLHHSSEKEIKRLKKVFDILGEEVKPVAQFLAKRILKSSQNYDRIVFLKGFKLMRKFLRMMFR